jgi:putative tryptophan/tyrosine transport system substrate-binding protein
VIQLMDRRTFLGASSALVLLVARRAAAQSGKLVRIGVLTGASDASGAKFEAFRQGLRDFGYAEGQNVVLEYRFARGSLERFPALAAELVQANVDIIVTDGGNAAAQAAKQATATIPIVMAVSGDPLKGLIASYARPGGNLTGLTLMSSELSAKRLQLLKEIAPKATRVAVLRNAANPSSADSLAATESAAPSVGVTIERFDVRDLDDLGTVLTSVARERPHAFLILPDVAFFDARARLVEFANAQRLPAMFPEREYADAGGLVAYGPNVPANFRRVAAYVDKIVKGARPSDLPVEQPTKLELLVNLRTSKALGITIPRSLLVRADRVIR